MHFRVAWESDNGHRREREKLCVGPAEDCGPCREEGALLEGSPEGEVSQEKMAREARSGRGETLVYTRGMVEHDADFCVALGDIAGHTGRAAQFAE